MLFPDNVPPEVYAKVFSTEEGRLVLADLLWRATTVESYGAGTLTENGAAHFGKGIMVSHIQTKLKAAEPASRPAAAGDKLKSKGA